LVFWFSGLLVLWFPFASIELACADGCTVNEKPEDQKTK
jgi:hypothetical protein